MTYQQSLSLYEPELYDEFRENGFVILKGFYQDTGFVEKIKKAIKLYVVNAIKYHIDRNFDESKYDLNSAYQCLLSRDRSIASRVYDAIKMIPEFNLWSHNPEHYKLAKYLLNATNIGFVRAGDGIRTDSPVNDFFSPMHQEFGGGQGRSTQGLVLWTPLIDMSKELGPVKVWKKSHQDGVIAIKGFRDSTKITAYNLELKNSDEINTKYDCIEPLLSVGDLLVFDYLTVHSSGMNNSSNIRFSMQTRFIVMDRPEAIEYLWKKADIHNQDYWNWYNDLVGEGK